MMCSSDCPAACRGSGPKWQLPSPARRMIARRLRPTATARMVPGDPVMPSGSPSPQRSASGTPAEDAWQPVAAPGNDLPAAIAGTAPPDLILEAAQDLCLVMADFDRWVYDRCIALLAASDAHVATASARMRQNPGPPSRRRSQPAFGRRERTAAFTATIRWSASWIGIFAALPVLLEGLCAVEAGADRHPPPPPVFRWCLQPQRRPPPPLRRDVEPAGQHRSADRARQSAGDAPPPRHGVRAS